MSCEGIEEYLTFLENISVDHNQKDVCDEVLLKRTVQFDLIGNEIIAEVISSSLRYLIEKKCPKHLLVFIIKNVMESFKTKAKECPILCSSNMNFNANNSTNIMLTAVASIQTFSQQLLHNVEFNKILSSSKENKNTNEKLISVFGANKNRRRYMEDRHTCIDHFKEIYNIEGCETLSFYAVFDGHDGCNASSYSSAQLPYLLAAQKNLSLQPEEALRKAFLETDYHFTKKCIRGGSTAVCALYLPETLRIYVAWVGDSKALLVKQREIMQIVKPHKPEDSNEKKRICESGGSVIKWEGIWRVDGLINLSRAIGNNRFKPYLTAEPDVVRIEMDNNEDFLVLACDGLWDHVDEEQVAFLIYESIKKNCGNVKRIPEILIDLAKNRGSSDNITIGIIFFKSPYQISEKINQIEKMDSPICNYTSDNEEVCISKQIPEDLHQHAIESDLKNCSKDVLFENLQQNFDKEISKVENNDYQPLNEINMEVSQTHLINAGTTFDKTVFYEHENNNKQNDDLKEQNMRIINANKIDMQNANDKTFECLALDFDSHSLANEFQANFADSSLTACTQDSFVNFADDKGIVSISSDIFEIVESKNIDVKSSLNLSNNAVILSSFNQDQASKHLIPVPQFDYHKSLSITHDERIPQFCDQNNINKNEKSWSIDKPLDISVEGSIEQKTKGQLQNETLRHNETELIAKFDSLIINENISNCLISNKEYKNGKNYKNNSGDQKLVQDSEKIEIKEVRTIAPDNNISEIVTKAECNELLDEGNYIQLKKDEGEKQETEKSEKVLPKIFDATTLDRKRIIEKQGIFKDKESEIKSKNSLVNQQFIDTINFKEIAETNDMNYRLNPNAKEFIPTSPPDFATLTNGYPKFQPRFDDVVAQSPRKSTINMENIQVPEEEMFDKEAAVRPHEVNEEIIISEQTPIPCGIICSDEQRNLYEKSNNSKKDVFDEKIIYSDQEIRPENAVLSVAFTTIHELNRLDMSRSIYIKKSDSKVENDESDLLNSIQAIPEEVTDNNTKENKNFSLQTIEISYSDNIHPDIVEDKAKPEINSMPIKEEYSTERDDGSTLSNKIKDDENEEISVKSDFINIKSGARASIGTKKQIFEKNHDIRIKNESLKNCELKKNIGGSNILNLPSKKSMATVRDINKNKSNTAILSKPKSAILTTQSAKPSITARPRAINCGTEKNKSQTNHLISKINLKNHSTVINKKLVTASNTNNNFPDNNSLKTSVVNKTGLIKNRTETKPSVTKLFTNSEKYKANKLANEFPSSPSKILPVKNGNLKSRKNPLAKTEANKSVTKPVKITSGVVASGTKNVGTLKGISPSPIINYKSTKCSSEKTMIKKTVSSTMNTTNMKPKTEIPQLTAKNVKCMTKKSNCSTNEENKMSDKFENNQSDYQTLESN